MTLMGNVQLVAGDASAVDAVLALLNKEGIETGGNPDVYTRVYTNFGVGDARELRERAQLSAVGERRVFIIAATVTTIEAQNALLKTLEETPGNSLFFFIVPSPLTLLPTIRSRSQIVALPYMVGNEPSVLIEPDEFLSSAPQKRLDMLKPLLEKGDEDKRDIAGITMFLCALERSIAGRGKPSRDALHAIYRARKYLGDKGSLVKPLLEQVALLTPKM